MENAAEVTPVVATEKVRKPRKVSDIRHLPGALAIKKVRLEVMKVHAEMLQHKEIAEKVSVALGVSVQQAFEMLKNPSGLSEVAKLASYIRGATLRSDIALDSVKLCRIAEAIEKEVGEANLLIPREKVKSTTESDGK